MNSLIASDGDNSYDDGTGQYAGNCAVGEMWGYAMGHIQDCEKHNETRLDDVYFNYYYWNGSWDNSPDYFRRAGDEVVEGDGGWIKPDPIWALITRGVLTKKQVFDCLTSDVDTVEELRARMCDNHPTKTGLINLAFTANDTANPTIEGPVNPALNTQVTYAVPVSVTGLPTGMTFEGFEVSGETSDRSYTYSLSSGDLYATFNTAMVYTITATYTLPDDTEYTVTKTIDLTPPPPPLPTPIISASANWVSQGQSVVFTVDNVSDTFDGIYQWSISGSFSYITTENYITFIPTESSGIGPLPLGLMPSYGNWNVTARCRLVQGVQTTAWSNTVSVLVISSGGGYVATN
jgi:hypothetical protein